ncbi:hypothetical protein R1flu_019219 [Riccia fluitans]|uniref:Uncharacterized protein n=1 Tax=Riccia fluitans TaxID=41844 RepID=A0ABD1ZI10_9MARC
MRDVEVQVTGNFQSPAPNAEAMTAPEHWQNAERQLTVSLPTSRNLFGSPIVQQQDYRSVLLRDNVIFDQEPLETRNLQNSRTPHPPSANPPRRTNVLTSSADRALIMENMAPILDLRKATNTTFHRPKIGETPIRAPCTREPAAISPSMIRRYRRHRHRRFSWRTKTNNPRAHPPKNNCQMQEVREALANLLKRRIINRASLTLVQRCPT